MGAVIFFLLFIVALIYGFYLIVVEKPKPEIKTQVYIPHRISPASARLFLEETFPYYRALTDAGKQKFYKRLQVLLRNKEFAGGQGFVVTDEMCYYILACWVQITFGLKNYKISSFQKIMLFETGFYSNRLQTQVKGMVAHNGTIYLSWADFVEGYNHPNDNYNLGIHELAHAFLISTYTNGDFDTDFTSYIDNWFEVAQDEFENIAQNMPSYLRNYAGTNSYEFFSVCMEVFFENPLELKTKLPDIFYHLCYLLNQNPLNTSADYSFDAQAPSTPKSIIPLPAKKAKTLKYIGFHWLYILPIISGVSLLINLRVIQLTFLTIPELLLLATCGLFIGLIKPIKQRLFSFFGTHMARLFIFFVFALGLPNIILAVNFLIPVSRSNADEYNIEWSIASTNKSGAHTEFILANDALSGHTTIRTAKGHFIMDKGYNYRLKIHYYIGALGIKVFEYSEVIKVYIPKQGTIQKPNFP